MKRVRERVPRKKSGGRKEGKRPRLVGPGPRTFDDIPDDMLVHHIIPSVDDFTRHLLRLVSRRFMKYVTSYMDVDEICESAAIDGYWNILKWAHANGYRLSLIHI